MNSYGIEEQFYNSKIPNSFWIVLNLNLDKIWIIFLWGPADMLEGILPRLDGTDLLLSDRVWNLEALLDPAIFWDSQVAAGSKSAFNQLRLIAQLCTYLN